MYLLKAVSVYWDNIPVILIPSYFRKMFSFFELILVLQFTQCVKEKLTGISSINIFDIGLLTGLIISIYRKLKNH